MKHALFFLAALLVIVLCAADKPVEKDVEKRAVVEEHDADEEFVSVPRRVAEMIADEMENDDEDELEDDMKSGKMNDGWWARRRRRSRRRRRRG